MKNHFVKYFLKKYRYIMFTFIVVCITFGSTGLLIYNLFEMEKNRIQEYKSLGEQISKSAMNYILIEQYDNLLDTMRLLVSTSSIKFMGLYMDSKMHTRAGDSSGLEEVVTNKPGGDKSWVYNNGNSRYIISDIKLAYHPDLIRGHCVLRIVFTLDKFLDRKENILLAILLIVLLMISLMISLYFLSRAEKSKSNTINEITHDARKILNRITPRLDNILFQFKKGDDRSKILRNIKLTWEESLAMNRYIDNLSDYENLSRGKMPVRTDNKDLIKVLKKKQSQFEVTLAKEGKHINLDLPCESLVIETDEYVLERILINIIDNAVKFTEMQTGITISLQKYTGYILILIKDYGLGIAKNQWKELFKPFKRLKSKKRGTGLGLYNARELARELNGDVGIFESELDVGTTIYIKLPYHSNNENSKG